jgi:hypothetical protein
MEKRITRRGLAVGLGVAAATVAQQNPEAQVQSEREQNRRAAETLRKFPMPAGTEPAFVFHA